MLTIKHYWIKYQLEKCIFFAMQNQNTKTAANVNVLG